MSEIAEQIYGENLEPQLPVDAAFLNRYSDVMEEDMQQVADVLFAMRRQPIVNSFIERTEMDRHEITGKIVFYGHEAVQCRDIDVLKNALLMGGVREEVFRPSIDRVRTQYAGLFYYHLKMLDLEDGENQTNEMLELMREMNECERYPERIYQDKTMMEALVESAGNFKDMRKVFNFMARNKYETPEGEQELVCKPDMHMFMEWFKRCEKAKHYKRVYQMAERMGVQVSVSLIPWLYSCEDATDFEYFFENVATLESGYDPKMDHFLNWYKTIDTYKGLDVFIRYLVQHDIEPDARLFKMIINQSKLKEVGGFGPEEFIKRFNDIYATPETSKRVSTRGMTTVHDLLMNGLTEARA